MDQFTKTYLNIINNIKPKKKGIVKEDEDFDGISFLVDSCGFHSYSGILSKDVAENTVLEISYPAPEEGVEGWGIAVLDKDNDEWGSLTDGYGTDPIYDDLKSAIEAAIKNAEEAKKAFENIKPESIDAAVTELQALLGKMIPVSESVKTKKKKIS